MVAPYTMKLSYLQSMHLSEDEDFFLYLAGMKHASACLKKVCACVHVCRSCSKFIIGSVSRND